MNHDYIPQKSFKSHGLWSPNRYEIDLSNELLYIDSSQETTKISKVKVRGQKNLSSTSFERSISYLFGDQSPRLMNDF